MRLFKNYVFVNPTGWANDIVGSSRHFWLMLIMHWIGVGYMCWAVIFYSQNMKSLILVLGTLLAGILPSYYLYAMKHLVKKI